MHALASDAELFGDLGCNGIDLLLTTRHDDDIRALIRERLGHLNAQAARSARDDSHLVLEVEIVLGHIRLLSHRCPDACHFTITGVKIVSRRLHQPETAATYRRRRIT